MGYGDAARAAAALGECARQKMSLALSRLDRNPKPDGDDCQRGMITARSVESQSGIPFEGCFQVVRRNPRVNPAIGCPL